jgi:hypothetical protein
MEGTARWFESGPSAILDDPELATLMVRIGMASNALAAQKNATHAAQQLPSESAVSLRDMVCLLITSAALTNEAIKLVHGGLAWLRPLASKSGAPEEMLKNIGRLCAGKHPASALLERARNQLGFHWDAELVEPSVREFGRNPKLVWMENDHTHTTHRLAMEVLSHALLPDAQISDETQRPALIEEAVRQVVEAMELIVAFSTASAFGYMQTVKAKRCER